MTQVTVLWDDMQKWHQHHNKYGPQYSDSLLLMRRGQNEHMMSLGRLSPTTTVCQLVTAKHAGMEELGTH